MKDGLLLDSNRLDDRKVLITGAGGDIGIATAMLLAARGAMVFGVDKDPVSLEKLVQSIPNAVAGVLEGDVTDEASVHHFVQTAIVTLGRIDVFFNNAGIEGGIYPIPEYPVELFQMVMAINVTGVFLGMKHVIPSMVATGGGSIINMSSAAGLRGAAGMSAYVASKHAVIGLTRSAAAEWARHGIRVNCVNPGPIAGRMMGAIVDGARNDAGEKLAAEMAARIPSGRFGYPEEVATVVAFLASEDARHINGAVHAVDGGATAAS